MQVFAAFKVADPQRVKAGLDKYYRDSHYDAGGDVFFIATDGETTRELATKIGLGDENEDGVTSGIVVPVTTFWGRQSTGLWEWIGVKQSFNGR